MTKQEKKKLIQQNAWTCSFEENMRWAQGQAEDGMIEAALIVADVAFHQLRIKAIHREYAANHSSRECQSS